MTLLVMASSTLADVGLPVTGTAVLLGLLSGVSVVLLFSGLQRVVDGRSGNWETRLKQVIKEPVVAPIESKKRFQFFLKNRNRSAQFMYGENVSSRSYGVTLARDLARADLKITVGEYMVISL